MSSRASRLDAEGVSRLDNDYEQTDVLAQTPEAVAGDARSRREQQIRRTLDELNRQNARDQVLQGDFARARLQEIHLGPISSRLVSAFTGAKRRRDWAESAVRAYSNAISLDPSLAEAYVGRASAYRFLSRYAEAKQDLARAGELGVPDAADDQAELEHRVRGRRIALAAVIIGVCLVCYLAVRYHGRGDRPLLPAQAADTPGATVETPSPAPAQAPKIPQRAAQAAPIRPPVSLTARREQLPPAAAPVVPGRAAPVNARASKPACAGRVTADGSCVGSSPARIAAASPPDAPGTSAEQQPLEDACPACSQAHDAPAAIPQLAGLTRQDAEMVVLACQSSEAAGADAYQACIAMQVASLEQAIPMPDLSVLPAIDQQLIRRVCVSAGRDGPTVYRRCVGSQLISLASAPDLPNLSKFPADRRRAIELACRRGGAGGAAAYHTCVDRQAKQARPSQPSVAAPKN